jgi:hypothetical protein
MSNPDEFSSPISRALRHFEAAEANLEKLERLFSEITELIPEGISFGRNPIYDERCRAFCDVLEALPKIDGWKPECHLYDLNDIAQSRMDARECDEIAAIVGFEEAISAPARELAEYHYRLNKKRRQLIREAALDAIGQVDENLRRLRSEYNADTSPGSLVSGDNWDLLKSHIKEIDTLLGSSVPRPSRWSDLQRHLYFGQMSDLVDILNHDWPSVKAGLTYNLYDQNEPVPLEIDDLASLVEARPRGPVATKLNWSILTAEDFERLLFALISQAKGYENPEWLMKTNAPDRGRDLSVIRIVDDTLCGVIRSRVIIQCKHWADKSISPREVPELKEQMSLWEPPSVDVLVIATIGRFSSDAVSIIEKHNQADRALRIEKWPESHLERLLAAQPALIAEFRLR